MQCEFPYLGLSLDIPYTTVTIERNVADIKQRVIEEEMKWYDEFKAKTPYCTVPKTSREARYRRNWDLDGICVPLISALPKRVQNRFFIFLRPFSSAERCLEMHTGAHEEMHALYRMDRLDAFEQKVREEDGVEIDLAELFNIPYFPRRKPDRTLREREECMCDFAGLYALRRSGQLHQVVAYSLASCVGRNSRSFALGMTGAQRAYKRIFDKIDMEIFFASFRANAGGAHNLATNPCLGL